MQIERFMEGIEQLGADFFTGVPDSQLKALDDWLYVKYGVSGQHIVAANEGAAVALAAGHYMATGRPGMVYMQNSGLGNAVNPIASLIHEAVYRIPVVFVVGWRGEPEVHDEPQHVFQGKITLPLLEILQIKYFILSADTSPEEFQCNIEEAKVYISQGNSVAFVVRKRTLESRAYAAYSNTYQLKREDAIEIILSETEQDDIVVSTTGKTSREVFEIRERREQGHQQDFLTVGSMGHASMIAVGIALQKNQRRVWCIEGDGAVMMHMGSMAVAAGIEADNFIHIILNNEAHETVGGMPVDQGKLQFDKIGADLGYRYIASVDNADSLKQALREMKKQNGSRMLEVKVALGSRGDLGRPTTTPIENRDAFMRFLREDR